MFNYKKNILISTIFLITLLSLTAIITFFIDPLQHYRKSSFYKPFPLDQRYMVWGLLKNYEYNAILLGTSMTENFRKDYVDADLKLNILRVPMTAASAYEENLIIKKALGNKNLKTIVYGLDLVSFRGKETRTQYGKNSLPEYIMNDSIFDDFKYLLNIDIFFEDNIKVFLTNIIGIKKEMIDFNRFWNWDYKVKFDKAFCIDHYNQDIMLDSNENYKFDELKKSFDYNILSYFEKTKDIKYIIYFPPYSILFWKSINNKNYFNDMLKFKRYILEKSIEYKNIKVYDFQIEKNITHDLGNYKDMIHHSGNVNRWIVRQIKEDNYVVTKDNINKHIETLNQQIKDYDTKNILK